MTTSKPIALVAQRNDVDLFTDGPRLIEAFSRRSVAAEIVPWGDQRDWSAFAAVVVRGTYDYVEQPQEFFAWAHAVEAVTRLANPAALLEWNGDKRYLRDLAAAGIATIPTRWVEPGDSIASVIDALPPDDFVVKPATSAGSRLAARYRAGERARAADHLERLAARGLLAMVQPYLASVDGAGEEGTFVFGGTPSHAINKSAALRPDVEAVDDFSVGRTQHVTAHPVSAELARFARTVISAIPSTLPPPTYARVDTLRDERGELVVIELELIEPFLFLETTDAGADRFADAVTAWMEA